MTEQARTEVGERLRGAVSKLAVLLGGRDVEAYTVGGFLRDALLGREPQDIDLAVAADPFSLGPVLADAFGGHYFPLAEEQGIARVLLPDRGVHIDLNRLAGPGLKVMSAENPVEYALPWVEQLPIHSGLSFASALRSLLRSDPDVIMIGEIRDAETLQVAMEATLTGHLVLTTLHTDEAASALIRMVDIGMDPFVVAEAAKLIIAQRLVRQLCTHCSKEALPSEDLLAKAAAFARTGGLGWEDQPKRFREPVGCAKCSKTGYRGRTVMAEALVVSLEIGAALRRRAGVDEIRTLAVGQGMTTMAADGIRRAAEGLTTLEEVLRQAPVQK